MTGQCAKPMKKSDLGYWKNIAVQRPAQNHGRSAKIKLHDKHEKEGFPHRQRPDPSTGYSSLAYRRDEYLVIVQRFFIIR
jgi:hypothetical protein